MIVRNYLNCRWYPRPYLMGATQKESPMKLDIRWKGTQRSEALSQHVHDRAHCALRPSAGRVRQIVVRLEDMNGPKGGVDKRCTVEVIGTFGVRVTEARDVDFYV